MKKRLIALLLAVALAAGLWIYSDSKKEYPNVIVVMGESFFDVTELPGVTYAADPVGDYHRAEEEGVSGRFYTRDLGFGTSAVELEVLTGIETEWFTEDVKLYEQPAQCFDGFPAIPRMFQRKGYYTAFLHTFNDGVYSRTPIYEKLGFDDLYFAADFGEIFPEAGEGDDYWAWMWGKMMGGYYSDDLMADSLISLAEREEEPVFLYAVTMENHQPYPADKYPLYNFPFEAEISEEAAGSLNSLTQGVANGSWALGKLMRHFAESEEPTVIVFFGDHLPSMVLEEGNLYTELGMASSDSLWDWSLEERQELYSTDYVIWANDESLLPAPAGTEKDTSCDFLGVEILELAGIRKNSWWRNVSNLREHYLAWSYRYSVAANGEMHSKIETCLDTLGGNRVLNMQKRVERIFPHLE